MKNNNKKANATLYSLPRLGTSIFMGLADTALLFLYHSVYGLEGFQTGIGLFFGKISIAFFQFFFGWLSDHTNTKFGRRKPYVFILAPILTISFILLLLPGLVFGSTPGDDQLLVWFIIFNIIFQGAYSITTPYQAWLAELFSVEDRPKVSARMNLFNMIGNVIMMLFSMVVLTDDALQTEAFAVPPILLTSVMIFGITVITLFYISAIIMPVEQTPKYETNMKDDLKSILKDKNFLLVTGMQGIASFSWSMIFAELLGFGNDVLGLDTLQFVGMAVVILGLLFYGLNFWKNRIKKVGKKPTLLTVFKVAIIGLPFILLMLILPLSLYLPFAFVFFGMLGISLGGWYIFPYILYADLAENDAKDSGELKAGLYTGFPAINLNIFQAISGFFAGWILDLPDFEFETGSFSIGHILWGPISAVVLVIAYIYANKYIKLDFNWEKESKN
ncbi:MAG: MFS transporter [archaeon]|nr:MFS transporter [archaeon]